MITTIHPICLRGRHHCAHVHDTAFLSRRIAGAFFLIANGETFCSSFTSGRVDVSGRKRRRVFCVCLLAGRSSVTGRYHQILASVLIFQCRSCPDLTLSCFLVLPLLGHLLLAPTSSHPGPSTRIFQKLVQQHACHAPHSSRNCAKCQDQENEYKKKNPAALPITHQ